MVQYTEQWEEERMNPGQCLPKRGRMRMCLGRGQRRASQGPVTFYFLRWVGDWMAFILLLFNLHLFPFFVYVMYFRIYKNISHWARVRRKPFPRLGWWPVVLCSRGPGRIVSNTVCQTIFWFSSVWQPPWQGKRLGRPVNTAAWESLRSGHTFLRFLGLIASCNNDSSLLPAQTSYLHARELPNCWALPSEHNGNWRVLKRLDRNYHMAQQFNSSRTDIRDLNRYLHTMLIAERFIIVKRWK